MWKKTDLLQDPMWKVILSIGLPLVVTSLLSVAVTGLSNEIYSRYVGTIYFTVTGYIGMVTSIYVNVINSFVSGAWIKTAKYYTRPEMRGFNRTTANGWYAVLIVWLLFVLCLLAGMQPIMELLSIPASVLTEVKTYYVIYVLSTMIVPVGSLVVMIVNGIAAVTDIFIVNCVNTCSGVVIAAVVLILFGGGLRGAALIPACNAVLLLLVSRWLLKRHGCKVHLSWQELKPDLRMIGQILRYGLLIALQNVICSVGYMLVAIQANRYLDAKYISVLNVTLPLHGIMNAFGTICTVVIPPNYETGRIDRVKQFVKISGITCVLNGLFVFVVYTLLGEWYYGRMFDDPVIIAYGRDFWRLYGLGFIFLAFLYTIRFFFDAVGYSKLALVSGAGELIGQCLCAFWLIPRWGNIGRSLAETMGWGFAALFLTAAFLASRRKIFAPGGQS